MSNRYKGTSHQKCIAHKKLFNIISHQGRANQSHNQTTLYTKQDGYYKKIVTTLNAGEDAKKVDDSHIVGENVNGTSILENSLAIS